MNYFTKNELKDLLSILNQSIADGTEPECIHLLRDKIQSMIDNYCEHECSHHELIRLKLLSQKEYDLCETCLYIRRIR